MRSLILPLALTVACADKNTLDTGALSDTGSADTGGTDTGDATDTGGEDTGAVADTRTWYFEDEAYGLAASVVTGTTHDDGSSSWSAQTLHDYSPYLELSMELVEAVELDASGLILTADVHMRTTVGATEIEKRITIDNTVSPATVTVTRPAGTYVWTPEVPDGAALAYYPAISDPWFNAPTSAPLAGWVFAQAIANADTVTLLYHDYLLAYDFDVSGASDPEGTWYLGYDAFEVGEDMVEAVDNYYLGISLTAVEDDPGLDLDLDVVPWEPALDNPGCEEESTASSFSTTSADGTELHGVISWPDDWDGATDVVVFNAGTGGSDREEWVGDLPRWTCLAEAFLDAGIAVVRYDDRGWGETGGDIAEMTFTQRSEDAAAVATWAAAQVDTADLFLLGHSEGVAHVSEAAAWVPEVDGVLLVAGIGGNGADAWIEQSEVLLGDLGLSSSYIDEVVEYRLDLVGEVLAGTYSDDTLGSFGIAFWEEFFAFDGGELAAQVPVPAAVFQGTVDWQVPLHNATDLEAAMLDAGNEAVTVYTYDGLGHFMSAAPDHVPSMGDEYALPIPWSEDFTADAVAWVQAH